ncbi:oligosaccharide flippase family protein [uncultured Sphingomonas sp.]|uniref:oligosaccharide flippase family protein n=1 Tax=uncultured Sphingomonas sp. TaxID=158754 RepID=UPI0035CB0DD6
MIRSVAIVMRGTVLAQGVGLLILPVLTRHFSPASFGQFQVFQSLLGLGLVAATMRYEIAILRAETSHELGALLMLCASINVLLAFVMLVGQFVYERLTGADFLATFGFPFFLIVAAFVFGGLIQYLGYFLVREKLFGQGSNSKVVQALANGGTALTLALTRPVVTGIVLADIAGRIGGALAMIALSYHRMRETVSRPSRADIFRTLTKYREYPLIAVPGGLVNMAGAMLTPIMIYKTFDAATSGQFGLLERSATLPIGLIAASVSQVYMAQLAGDLRAGGHAAVHRFNRLVGLLAMLAIPPAIIIALFAPWLFAFAFGPGWDQAAGFARLMMPAYSLSLVSGAVNMTLIVVGWQKMQLAWEIARLVTMTGLWVGGAQLGWSVGTMVAGHSAILTFFAAVTVGLSAWAVRISEGRVVALATSAEEAAMGSVA